MKDNGAYADAALATLRSSLNANIATINLEPGALVLPTIDANDRFLFGGEDAGPILRYPAVEVAAPDRTLTSPDLNYQGWDATPTVVVRGWLTYDENVNTYSSLYRATMRFGRALLRTLIPRDAFGPSVVWTQIEERYRADLTQLTADRQDYVGFALLVFTLSDSDAPDAPAA